MNAQMSGKIKFVSCLAADLIIMSGQQAIAITLSDADAQADPRELFGSSVKSFKLGCKAFGCSIDYEQTNFDEQTNFEKNYERYLKYKIQQRDRQR